MNKFGQKYSASGDIWASGRLLNEGYYTHLLREKVDQRGSDSKEDVSEMVMGAIKMLSN